MSRGKQAAIGARNQAPNGYWYEKTSTGWRLLHHIIAEQAVGHPIDTKIHRVTFKDNNRENLDPSNLIVTLKQKVSEAGVQKKVDRIEEQMTAIVEQAEPKDRSQILDQLKDALNEVRLKYGFGRM